MPHEFQLEIDAINRIGAVPTILDVVCRSTGMRFAAVARVTEDRWITCSSLDSINFGLKPGSELKVETTICHEIRQSHQPVVINHVAESQAYCRHHTPATYRFQSYISMPIIRKDGSFFGTLCAIDPEPAKLENPETIGMFKLFAELIAAHLDSDDELLAAKVALKDEREMAEVREQFIAVLGHDLRNPLAAIQSGIQLLLREPLPGSSRDLLAMMQGSVVRMKGLIDNVLDFARARLGDSLNLHIEAEQDLKPLLQQVVDELSTGNPGREISTDFRISAGVQADPVRLGQLFSNLLGNALTHGSPQTKVRVSAHTDRGLFTLWVENEGEQIPLDVMATLFRPFFRGKVGSSQQGLGLGLYIAHEIARRHGGVLDVDSNNRVTRFTFKLPLADPNKP